MHQPRPYGRFAHEADLSGEDAAAVERLARELTNFKTASQLDSLKRVTALSDGRQAVAIDMGGTFRIIILERYEDQERVPDGLAEAHIPMLFSGVVTRWAVRDGEGVGIKLTEQTRRRLANYGDELPPKEVALQRFRIEYSERFRYFLPDNQGIFTHTQYAKLRPTWYSGAMAEVMQIVGGYGRQTLAELPDDPIERARMIVPERYMRRIRLELNNVRLPGYSGFPDEKGQFKCDYKHGDCNAVAFDSGGAPWLLQIGSRGVYAMPLPVAPATTTEAFREYVESVGDGEIEKILDRFGGMPTGEPMPAIGSEAFESWRRAGVIIKVCETGDFYEHNAYYAASGWSFNSQGTEGFNTCWNVNGAGLKQGYAYKMQLRLGASASRGMAPLAWEFASQEEADKANAYLSSIYRSIGNDTAKAAAIKYKLRRHTASEVLARASGSGGAAEAEYWDALEMEPIASHSGSVTRVASGPIYWGFKEYPQSQGRLKFPELTGAGCESFVMVSPDYEGGMVRCDTIVFGCYVDDELQVIKYFLDEREFFQDEESTFEAPMIVGRWEKTTTTGVSGLMGYFYTSAFDDRAEAPPVSQRTEVVGTDMGYGNPAYHTPGVTFRVGSLSRARYYQHRTKVSTTEGFSLDAAVCVPVYSRDCILYAYQEGTSGTSYLEFTTMGGISDPTSYQLWIHDDIWHWIGVTGSGLLGEPPSKDGTPVYVDTLVYLPTEVSDFADSGNWFNLPPGSFKDVTGICGPYTSRYSGTFNANGVTIGGEPPGFNPYHEEATYPGTSSGRVSVSLSVAGSVVAHRRVPDGWYYSFSPVENNYFYRDACRVTFGDASFASISEQDQYGQRSRWGYSSVASNNGAHHFIGVINE